MHKKTVSASVQNFFDKYEKNINTQGSDKATSQYGDSIMIATPQGAYAFKKEDFIKVLPARKQFFDATGFESSNIVSLSELENDEFYFLVKAVWNFKFKKDQDGTFDIQVASTYILQKNNDSLKIIFQLDHEDLMKKIKNHLKGTRPE